MAGAHLTDQQIERIRRGYDRCFGCGSANHAGLQLDDFRRVGDGVEAPFTPARHLNGFEGVVHGGAIATALDETSAWAAMLTHGVFVFTARLDIRYRAEVRVDTPYVLRGAVTDRRGRRLTIVAGVHEGERVVASSEGLFVVASEIEDAETT